MKIINKILLCALNSKFIHSTPAVYSLKNTALSYAEKFSVEFPHTVIKEFSINDTKDSIMYSILKENADVIGFSVYIWNCDYIQRLCRKIKTVSPDTMIILGGPQVSYGIQGMNFLSSDYDYIIEGEGERAFFSLISRICSNGFVPDEEWKFIFENKKCSAKHIENLSEIPFVYNEENLKTFDNRIIYYEASRGCPFRCAYCLSAVCGKVRGLELERVKSDLFFFLNHNVRQVKFVDRTFNYDKERAKEIWKFLIENGGEKTTNFHFEISADLLDEESIEILSTAPDGLFRIEVGIQSFNQKTLQAIGRKSDENILTENIKAIVMNGNMTVHADLIAGLPLENYESFKTSFNKAYSIKAHQLQLGFLKLLPGAPMNEMIEKYGYIFDENSPYEVIKNNDISYPELFQLKRIEDCFERVYNSARFIYSLSELEKLYETPYELYDALSEEFDKNDILFTAVSTKIIYGLLHEFYYKKIGDEERRNDFDKKLLLDFYCCERTDQLPVSLRYLSTESRKRKNALVEKGIKEDKNHYIRFIGKDVYIFDYSSKNPVTERYKYFRFS